MTPIKVVGYLFAAAVTVSCVAYLRSGWLKQDLSVFKGRGWKEWVQIVVGDLLAIGSLVGCYQLATWFPNPVTDFTWLRLIATKGEDVIAMNQLLAGAQIRYFGILFVVLLFLNLPRLAAAEEESYRLGTKDWRDAVPRSLRFGLMHMVVGVPLWCGLALSIPGMWFTYQYFKGGVERSTMTHALYNMILASVLLVWVVQANLVPDEKTVPVKTTQSSQGVRDEGPRRGPIRWTGVEDPWNRRPKVPTPEGSKHALSQPGPRLRLMRPLPGSRNLSVAGTWSLTTRGKLTGRLRCPESAWIPAGTTSRTQCSAEKAAQFNVIN